MTKSCLINWRLILLIIALTSIISPYIGKFYRGYVGLTVIFLIILFIVFVSPIGNYFVAIIKPTFRVNRKVFITLFWFIIGIAITYFRGANDISYLIQVIFILVFFMLGLFLSQESVYKSFTVYSLMAFCIINIFFTGSSIGELKSARDIYIESGMDLVSGTTDFWGMIGIFFPLFVVETIKQKKLIKILLLLALFILLYKLLFSGFATPIALLFINIATICVIYLIYHVRFSYRGFKSLLLIIFSIGVVYSLFIIIMRSELPGMSDIQYRFENFIINPAGGGYSEGSKGISRFELVLVSWDTFISNPIFGGGGNIRTSIYEGISSGHSSAFDFLAVLGIMGGGGAFLYFIWISMSRAYNTMKRSKSFSNICNFSIVVAFTFGGIMNPYWQSYILIAFLLLADIYYSPFSQPDQ